MPLFGICPSRDEVYFVVCEHCKQVFKPQALVHHIGESSLIIIIIFYCDLSISERRHSNHVSHTSTKLTQSSLLKANGKNDLKINELNGNETKLLNCANSSVNAPLNAIVETNKNSDNVLKSDSTANSSIGLEPTGPGPGLTNVINSNCDQKTIVKTAKKKSYKKSGLPSTRKLLPCKDREYDANKHCGVWLPDMEKPCTRSLTCKTHSLTLRRAVQGRIKNFDELLAEHRAEKEEALRAQGIEVKPTKKDLLKMQRQQQLLLKQQKLEASQSSKCNNSSATKQTLQIHTETNINLKNSSITKENINCSVNTTLSSSTLSQQSQPINVHMNHHPQPVALCNYNVRRISSCVRLTNRKWDLTASLLMSAFNSPKVKNVIGTLNASEKNNTNNNLSSYTTNSIKNSILNNQLSPLKKLHVELNPLELQTQSDPYNFPDAAPITNLSSFNSSSFNSSSFNSSSFNSSSFTLIKPKTPTAKNSFLPSVNKKRKNDTNIRLNSDQHSSLLNGQLSQSFNKKACVNSKRSNNNSNKKMKTNISSINLPTTNSQDQQIFHSSTSLNTLHNKNLNVSQIQSDDYDFLIYSTFFIYN